DADVVAEALAHAAHAVEAAQDRQRHADLRFLAGVALQVAADHQAEQLLAAAQLDVRTDLHAVEALHQRVQALVQPNGRAGLEALGEIVALQHALHGDLAGQRQHVEELKAFEPVAVVGDLGALDVDDLANLREVILGVGLDLLLRQAG